MSGEVGRDSSSGEGGAHRVAAGVDRAPAIDEHQRLGGVDGRRLVAGGEGEAFGCAVAETGDHDHQAGGDNEAEPHGPPG